MLGIATCILILGGVVTLAFGLLLGFPLRTAINQQMHEDAIRAWRVAHSSIINGGIMLLALVPTLQYLPLPPTAKGITTAMLVVSTGSFCYALVLGAYKGHRGLDTSSNATANVAFYANVIGALVLLGALAVILVGSIMLLFH